MTVVQPKPTRFDQIALLSFAVLAPALLLLPINHDAVWQMWIGRQMLHGTELYSGIVEVNPPLWFWIAVPLAWLAEMLAVPGTAALVGFFIASIGLSLFLTSRFDRRPIVLAAFVLAVIPLLGFGQREHFTLIAAIPYVLLIEQRQRGEPVPANLAIAIGLFAAVGFALKPHFALVPIALEMWLHKRPFRPETWALGLSAIAYGAAIGVFAPAYVIDILPLASSTYAYFSSPPVMGLWFMVPLLLASLHVRNSALLVASLAFYLAMLLQGKAWSYHALPGDGLLLLAIASAPFGRSLWREALSICAAILILLPHLGLYENPAQLRFQKGKSAAVLSYSTLPAWPMADKHRWPLRHMALWTLPAIVETGNIRLLDRLRREVTHDLACNPPDVIATDRRGVDVASLFPEPLAHYRLDRIEGGFAYYELAGRPPRPTHCREIY